MVNRISQQRGIDYMSPNTEQTREQKGRKPILQISIEQDALDKIEALAKKEDRTISSMGRILITQALNSKENRQ